VGVEVAVPGLELVWMEDPVAVELQHGLAVILLRQTFCHFRMDFKEEVDQIH
jgi:hypothetical protein